MYKDKYLKLKEELTKSHPRIMSDSFLFKIRLITAIVIIVLAKLAQKGLPIYDITCVDDRVLDYFLTYQIYLTSYSEIMLQYTFIFITISTIILTILYWIFNSNSLRLPITILLFYICKFVIDLVLYVAIPSTAKWHIITVINVDIGYNDLFFSNVDPYIGINVIFFLYYLTIENVILKKVIIGFMLFSIIFTFFFLVVFQLSHSYSMFSGLFVALFSDIIAKKVEKSGLYKVIQSNNDLNNNSKIDI